MTDLVFEGLTKRFGATTAVDDCTFRVRPGVVTGFLGPNGSGKTTSMRALLGLLAPTSGSATFDGRRYAELNDPPRTVGALLEADAFHPGRSGRDHLRILASAARIPVRRVDEVLELVGLTDAAGRAAGGYSLGMRQRLGLAGALLGEPGVLILDEPANGLDPQGVRWLRDLLRHEANNGATVFVSSHLLAEMALIAEEVVVIRDGRLVAHDRLDALTGAASSGPVLVRSPHGRRLAAALVAAGADVMSAADGLLHVRALDAPAIGRLALSEGLELHELTPQRATLEDAFLELTS
ncbi:MAG TPA: ATP-binding cassette domain-containing protein [Egicoccus sp.]|nr:ATP-binding cassette domain-containing protein [Egicoccus sp.]HSK24568.1 ATP-binding cassette domain-containing protein [Egicoccus sp.]